MIHVSTVTDLEFAHTKLQFYLKTSIKQLYVEHPLTSVCIKIVNIYHDAVHCYGENILIYFPKISNR